MYKVTVSVCYFCLLTVFVEVATGLRTTTLNGSCGSGTCKETVTKPICSPNIGNLCSFLILLIASKQRHFPPPIHRRAPLGPLNLADVTRGEHHQPRPDARVRVGRLPRKHRRSQEDDADGEPVGHRRLDHDLGLVRPRRTHCDWALPVRVWNRHFDYSSDLFGQ